MSDEEWRLAGELAEAAGLSRSEFIRQLILKAAESGGIKPSKDVKPSLRVLSAKRQAIVSRMRSLLKEAGGWEAFQELRDAYRRLGGVTPTKPEDLPQCDQAMAKLAREYEKFGLTPQEVALYATLYDLAKQLVQIDAKILDTLQQQS